MIIKKNLKGIATKKDEILGEFTSGGFSSKVNYIDHLKDLNKIRLDNGQNLFFVNFLFFIKILKKPLRFIKSIIYNK